MRKTHSWPLELLPVFLLFAFLSLALCSRGFHQVNYGLGQQNLFIYRCRHLFFFNSEKLEKINKLPNRAFLPFPQITLVTTSHVPLFLVQYEPDLYLGKIFIAPFNVHIGHLIDEFSHFFLTFVLDGCHFEVSVHTILCCTLYGACM